MRASRLPEGFGKEDSENEGWDAALKQETWRFRTRKDPKKNGQLM